MLVSVVIIYHEEALEQLILTGGMQDIAVWNNIPSCLQSLSSISILPICSDLLSPLKIIHMTLGFDTKIIAFWVTTVALAKRKASYFSHKKTWK